MERCNIINKTKSIFVLFLVFLTSNAPIIIVFAFYTSQVDASDKMPVPNCETTLPCSLISADLFPWKRAGIDQIIKQKNELIFLKEQEKAEKIKNLSSSTTQSWIISRALRLESCFLTQTYCFLCKKFETRVPSTTSKWMC